MLFFALLAAASQLAQAIDPPRVPHQPLGNGTKLLNYNITTENPGALVPSSRALNWVSTGQDGEYIYTGADGSFIFENIVTGKNKTFLSADKVPADYWDYFISPDATRVLWAVNHTKQYRHSYFADYMVQDVASGEAKPLVADSTGDIQYAEWNPASSSQIAFVQGNNLYIWNDGKVTQITSNGGPDMFNAVPDWVYEEEIFSSRFALWYSPDGKYIAYLSFNETGVETFRVPYYMNKQTVAPVYPRELELRYPKVGTKNPTVAFSLVDVDALKSTTLSIDAWSEDDIVVGEVSWVTDTHEKVIYRAFNRVQDHEKLVLVDVASGSSSVIRQRDGSDGWIDNNLAITYIGSLGNSSYNGSANYYLDMSDESGWNHLYLFPVSGGEKIALTSGEWEVVSILKIDTKRGLVYYTSTQHHSTERHIYSVSYKTLKKTALVDDTIPAVWSASFSSGGSYYVLRYSGPDVPYQELYSVNSSTPIRTITSNKALYDTLQTYKLPNITYYELDHPSGHKLNAMLRLPPNFSPNKKYPMLLIPYGGPGAQEVSKSFSSFNWKAYITSDPELEYITFTVDNRGTGYKGRAFRSAVVSNLGDLEAQDQVWAAKQLAKNSWVDSEKIGIWGWSYGGYLSSKVLELNDPIISLGLITAPVSDWRFYDSMYTERYMKTPTLNLAGYNKSRVHDTTGFKNVAGGFLIQHGTGDDNVHFQNSAALVDLLMGDRVSPEKMAAQWFTDSDHGISYHNGGKFLYKQLSKKLFEEKNRKASSGGGHQWSRRGMGRKWIG
ncbi:dipeptidyl peptidase IV N-terminal region-domain-containing protein [Clohesyomyces aquaticus]|uniref:dipeptidyl-peptidase IV n=1 Tax=Clohesyomyces aquaticus TaxID=1231657 RepID=A0A1Y2A3D3_9PLEO|nr:dipeptidyl peptidase IV N-terminal region-domain-containing protein [Clohesyomyces aquaticus]